MLFRHGEMQRQNRLDRLSGPMSRRRQKKRETGGQNRTLRPGKPPKKGPHKAGLT